MADDSSKKADVGATAKPWTSSHASLARDLDLAAEMPLEALRNLVDRLGATNAPLRPQTLFNLVENEVDVAVVDVTEIRQKEVAQSVIGLLVNLPKITKHDPAFVEATILRWRDDPPARLAPLDADRAAHMLEIARLFGQPINAVLSAENIERVLQLTGMRLSAFDIVCDIRPIFDQSGQRIETLVPIATLKIQWQMDDSDVDSVEVRLTSAQVEELGKKVKRAVSKLSAMEKYVAEDVSQASDQRTEQ